MWHLSPSGGVWTERAAGRTTDIDAKAKGIGQCVYWFVDAPHK